MYKVHIFSKFYGKVGIIVSWLLFHLIWKNYILFRDLNCRFFSLISLTKNNFSCCQNFIAEKYKITISMFPLFIILSVAYPPPPCTRDRCIPIHPLMNFTLYHSENLLSNENLICYTSKHLFSTPKGTNICSNTHSR